MKAIGVLTLGLVLLIKFDLYSQSYREILEQKVDVKKGHVLYLKFINKDSKMVLSYSFLEQPNDFRTVDSTSFFIVKDDLLPVYIEPVNPLNLNLKPEFYAQVDQIQSNYDEGMSEILSILNRIKTTKASLQGAMVDPSQPNCNSKIDEIIKELDALNSSIILNQVESINKVFSDLKSLSFHVPSTVLSGLNNSITDINKIKTHYSDQEILINELKKLIVDFTCSEDIADGKFKSLSIKMLINSHLTEINNERGQQLKRLENLINVRNLMQKIYDKAILNKGLHDDSWFIYLGEVIIKKGNISFLKIDLNDSGFKLEKDEIVPVKDILHTSYNIKFRKFQNFIPNVTAGLAWINNIDFYKYGTTVDEITGNTIVSRAGLETVKRLNVTTMINFYKYSNNNGQVLFPFFQIGAGTNLESPALFLGCGLDLISGDVGKLSLSIGGAGIFRKDLDQLEVGEVISGTATLEEDYINQPKIGYYFSLQWNVISK